MKLDMGKAWSDATGLIGSNFGLLTTIVGLFYFLPSFAITLLVPEVANPTPPPAPGGSDPEAAFRAMMETLQEQYATGWPYFLATTLAAYVGSVAVLALFAERGNPTVGDALKAGFRGAPIYLATQLIFGLAIGLVGGLLVTGAVLISPFLGILVGIIVLVAAVYASIKLILIPAIIGIEGDLNPISVMKRSWALTKGNSLLIFVFLFVLLIVVGLVSLVVTLVLTTILAAFGEPVASIGAGFVSSLSSAIVGGLFLCVVAAIHRQLAPGASKADLETFD